MRIGIDTRPLLSPYETGVGVYTTGLLTALFSRPKRHEYILFSNGRQRQYAAPPFWNTSGVEVVHRRFPNTLLHASLALTQWPSLDRLSTSAPLDLWFSPNLHFTTLSNELSHILMLHDLSFEHFPDLFFLKQRLWHRLVRPREQAKHARMIVTPSEHTRRDVIETYGISEDRVAVISPGCPILPEISDEKVEHVLLKRGLVRGRYLLFVGAIEPRKNLVALIRAFYLSSLPKDGFKLVLVGPLGWRSSGVKKEAGEGRGVFLTGFVSPIEKAALYRGAALFVYPSIYEGFGLPILEAFAASVPVVTSNRSSLPEVAGSAAFLVNPMNIEEIRWGIEEMVGDTALAAWYREAGHKRARDFFWERAAGELEEVFERSEI